MISMSPKKLFLIVKIYPIPIKTAKPNNLLTVIKRAMPSIIPNKYLFIAISGLLFGSLHIIGNINAWYDILYIIPYSAPGIIFAYINICPIFNMAVHFGLCDVNVHYIKVF